MSSTLYDKLWDAHVVAQEAEGQALIYIDRMLIHEVSSPQVALLERNCAETGIEYVALYDVRQGIVHVIGPEQGFTLPGTTLVCGDSRSATHETQQWLITA